MQKINYGYLNLYKEVPLLLEITLLKKKYPENKTGRVLIANSCPIGEFVASLPALMQFIKNKPMKFDMIVSPAVESLAKKIKGIENIYLAKPVHTVETKSSEQANQNFGDYDLVVVIRTSEETNRILRKIRYKEIKTSAKPMIKYILHLTKQLFIKANPRTVRHLIFNILDKRPKEVSFGSIFNFTKEDYSRLKEIPCLKTKDKIILVHTGSNWGMKKWDNNKWVELIEKINSFGKFRFIFVGSKDSVQDYNNISKKLNFKIYSLIEKINLVDLLLIMRQSDYFMGIDSGPRNMAHLADLRSITLLGPSGRLFMPLNKKDIVIDKTTRWNLYETFFYKKNRFVNSISVDEGFNAFKKLSK